MITALPTELNNLTEIFDACINSKASSGSVVEPGLGDTKTVPGFKAMAFLKFVTPFPSIPKHRAPALKLYYTQSLVVVDEQMARTRKVYDLQLTNPRKIV